MKVPCTECNKVCKRKVVNRGTENLNRIYYKCEDCNHKVGWEDELAKGAKPWTKKPKLIQSQQANPAPAPTAPAQPEHQAIEAGATPHAPPAEALPRPLETAPPAPAPAPQPPPQPPPQGPARRDTSDEAEVEILFERQAPNSKGTGRATATATATAAATGKATHPHALSPDSCEEAGERPAPPQPAARPRTRSATQALQPPKQAVSSPPSNAAASQHIRQDSRKQQKRSSQQNSQASSQQQPPQQSPQHQQSPRPPPQQQQQQQQQQRPQQDAAADGIMGAAKEALAAAAAAKRKFDEAFTDVSGRAAKRPVHDSPTGDGASAAAAVFAARSIPGTAAPRAASVQQPQPSSGGAAGPGPQPAPAASGSRPSPSAQVPSIKVHGAPFIPRAVLETLPLHPSAAAAGVPGTAAPGMASMPPGRVQVRSTQGFGIALGVGSEGTETFNPGARPTIRIVTDNEEMLRQEVRRLRRELAVATAQLREEQARSQNEAAAAAGMRIRLESLEREVKELRVKQQASTTRERQLTERLNLYIAQERAAQQAQAAQAHAQQQAYARAQQQAQNDPYYVYTWYQQQQRQHQHQQAHQQNPQQQQQQQQQHPQQQQHYQDQFTGSSAHGPAGGERRTSNGGDGGRGAARNRPKAPGAGGASAGAGATAGANGAAEAMPQAQDESALLAFALSSPPQLDETATVRALKQFLTEAGVQEATMRTCSEKADLLALARERLNSWEIRRAVACSRLSLRPQGDLALFRITSGTLQQRAVLAKAYRELMLRLHPDKNPGDEMATAAVQYLSEAYKRLQVVFPA